mmetsp:Transcript_131725/g.312278  ORF Transcript_131725/g.312278 Transcript_131725/m.312278 type:complete len:219 (-) Transcript_131725:987-1643(-)
MCELLQEAHEVGVMLVNDVPNGFHSRADLFPLISFLQLGLCQVRVVSNILVQLWPHFHHGIGVILIDEAVTELIVADLPILARIKGLHDEEGFLFCDLESPLDQGVLELRLRQDAIVVRIELTEDVPCQRVLLPHAFTELLQHSLQVKVALHTAVQVLPGVLVHVENLKLSVVDLDDLAWQKVLHLEQATRLLIEVDSLLQELASHDAHVSLRRFVDG